MGRSCILTLAVLIILQFGRAAPQADSENNTVKLDGTWELVGHKYGSTAPYSAMPKDRREIKLIFGDRRPKDLIGKAQLFRISINGDKWQQSGVLSNGLRIEETWRRIQ